MCTFGTSAINYSYNANKHVGHVNIAVISSSFSVEIIKYRMAAHYTIKYLLADWFILDVVLKRQLCTYLGLPIMPSYSHCDWFQLALGIVHALASVKVE